ncbi:hypothetical protein [Candidatus Nitrospira inopinata]|uniref:Uncharacterized protein n=1 Tax=Candidatus Nitrospira inopinata TaxID=1715989 RepID=A0A0S4KQ62_9BACT|nr:hypothetical protein [Candidatus Nitrospira inopinata]CUQ66577.1 protein of unknown function [Candidatus Nitrospira inopinata]
MTCSRCEGLMLEEYLFDLDGGCAERWATSWRCVNCGQRDDAVIRQHRRAKPAVVAPAACMVPEMTRLPREFDNLERFAA